jgi:hypothetical protein
MTTRPRHPESGYVLLYVFSMSAIIAIGLYEQLPRAAFEAQREKEALLINHGEQYKRGVQLYVRKMGRYPAKMEDLDNTQNIRFLRKHYIDPMTGKEEWRLLHMGANGKLIDSKIKKDDPNASQWHQGSITEFKSAGTSDDGDIMNANIATRKRPSDDQVQLPLQGGALGPNGNPDPTQQASGSPGGSSAGGAPGTTDPNAPPRPPGWLAGGALPGMPGGQRGLTLPQAPTITVPNPNSGSATGSSDQSGSSVAGNGGYGAPSGGGPFPTVPQPGLGQGPGGPVGPNGQQYNTAPGSNMNPQTGFGQQGAQSTASNMINNLLTQPRPGGAPTGLPGSLNGIGGTVMGGLAGVASTYKGRGIKHYNDQDEYTKWEFFYDLGAEQAAAAQAQTNQMNQGGGFGSQAPQGGAQGGGFSNQNPSQSQSQQTQQNQNNGITSGSQGTLGGGFGARPQ